ncbi:putative WRKY transcription factor 48 [Bidens hawaiensis]|uniref:putative WRKY transcription factor 48 n=1 Tax=Bidens hawaiensis TaxID=980011 RepID=UPI00404960BC
MSNIAMYDDGRFFDEEHMDMLAFEDYAGASFSDLLQRPSSTMLETSEVVTNSSPISASSNEPENDFNHLKSDDDQQNTTNKQLKAKKKNPKNQKEPRFAFVTKTEVDHLDDGYRWRKYGQKAVKNSPFPRSYYRCTSASCRVKKRIERSSENPWMVVTTYEGTHTHPCPINPTYGGGGGGGGGRGGFLLSQSHYQQPFFPNHTDSLSFNTTNVVPSSDSHNYFQEGQYHPSSLLRDHGLLQDMLSFQVSKEEAKEQIS